MNFSHISLNAFLVRFENVITLLQNDTDYQPSKVDIQKSALLAFVTQLHQSNNKVSLLETNLKTLKSKRLNMSFKSRSTTPNLCLQSIMINVLNYIGAENGKEHSIYTTIKSYLGKLTPKPKIINEDGSKGNSRSEKTFSALASYFENMIYLISNANNLIYTPTNPTLKLANLSAISTDFLQLNKDIIIAEKNEKAARQERQALFNGNRGAKELLKDIKMYLLSYEGGKQNVKYFQFMAILNQ